MNASFTVPVGPLRCLPMMISATPFGFLVRLAVGVAVLLLAVDEHDDVGVLLEGARLAQVGQLRPMIGARFGRAD